MNKSPEPLTPIQFRKTMGLFATGVTVMITEADNQVHGMTANSVSSLSLDPMLILICVKKNSKSSELVKKAGFFSINILSSHQEVLSNYFAGIDQGRKVEFHMVPWNEGKRLEGCLASILCAVDGILEGGDHWIVIGKVRALHWDKKADDPLLVFGGSYRSLSSQPIAPAPDTFDPLTNIPQIFYDPWESQ